MITQDTILLLAEKALQEYLQGTKPDSFATTAAYDIAKIKAHQNNKEAAGVAATVAVSAFVDSSIHAVEQAISITKIQDASKKHQQGRKSDSTSTPFDGILEKLKNASITQEAHTLYDAAFNAAEPEFVRAKNAALNMYMHAYTTSRAAYTHAIAVSAQYEQGEQRNRVFKNAIIERLKADLMYEPLAPSFFMSIMCSNAMKVAAVTILIAGLALLALGICGLTIPALGATLIGTAALLTTVGAVATATGTGLLVGGFFAQRRLQEDKAKSREAVEAVNCMDSSDSGLGIQSAAI